MSMSKHSVLLLCVAQFPGVTAISKSDIYIYTSEFKSVCVYLQTLVQVSVLRCKHRKYRKSQQVQIPDGNCREKSRNLPHSHYGARQDSLSYSVEKSFLKPNLTAYLFDDST